jgi:hypothetical protein
MSLLTKEIKAYLPRLGTMQEAPDPILWCKFVDPAHQRAWYAVEGELQGAEWRFWGYCLGAVAEFGYFTVPETRPARSGKQKGKTSLLVREKQFKPCFLADVRRKDLEQGGRE